MWALKTTTVPEVVGALGTVKKDMKTTPTKSLAKSLYMNSKK